MDDLKTTGGAARRRGNLKAHRDRLKVSGWRRVDVTLTAEEWAVLESLRQPGETNSMCIARILFVQKSGELIS